jgi:hypothetical protein
LLVDQRHHLAEQFVEIEDGGDGSADLGYPRKLISAAAQVSVETSVLHSNGDLIRESPEHQKISLVETLQLIALHVKNAEYPALDLERECHLGLGLGEGIYVPVLGIAAYVVGEDLLTCLCDVTDNPLAELYRGSWAFMTFRFRSTVDTSHPCPAEQGLSVRFQGEQGHVVVTEGTEDEVDDAASELIEIEDVCNLGTHPAYERELLQPPTFYGDLVACL